MDEDWMNLTYDILNIHREGSGMFCLVGRFTLQEFCSEQKINPLYGNRDANE